jgi:hypothetical protein
VINLSARFLSRAEGDDHHGHAGQDTAFEVSRRVVDQRDRPAHGFSINTAKSWLEAGKGAVPKYRRPDAPTVLAPYQDRLQQWLEADARRAQRDRRTALALDGPLVVLPNGIKTAHPALRPRDVAIRRALGLAKELGVVQQQPPMAAEESPYAELLKGYRRA